MHKPYRLRRIIVSVVAACTILGVQLVHPAASDAPAPVALSGIGIGQSEARPVERHAGVPLRVDIPAIGVNAPVVPVGLIGDGKMDVPEKPEDVGWYELGPLPGQEGNAVLDGHLDIDGAPGVFFRLKHLRPGDVVRVTDDHGTVRSFRVRESVEYDVHDAPMRRIFGPSDGRHLNIITCAGVWRTGMNHYDKRLVVYTDLIEE